MRCAKCGAPAEYQSLENPADDVCPRCFDEQFSAIWGALVLDGSLKLHSIGPDGQPRYTLNEKIRREFDERFKGVGDTKNL